AGAGAVEPAEVVTQPQRPAGEDEREGEPVGHLELPAVDDGGDDHGEADEGQRPVLEDESHGRSTLIQGTSGGAKAATLQGPGIRGWESGVREGRRQLTLLSPDP